LATIVLNVVVLSVATSNLGCTDARCWVRLAHTGRYVEHILPGMLSPYGDHRRQPVLLFASGRSRGRDRPRRGDGEAPRPGRRRPLRPPLRAAEVRQDEPAPARAPRR